MELPTLRAFRQRIMAALRRQALVLKAMSFASIGVVNTLVDLGLFLLSLKYLTSSLIVANVLAWTVAVTRFLRHELLHHLRGGSRDGG